MLSQIQVSILSDTVCPGNVTSLASTSTSASSNIISYAWDLDQDGLFDDALDSAIQHSFDTSATILVGLQVTTNLAEVANAYFSVHFLNAPQAHFFATNVCEGNSLQFNNNSLDGDVYLWSFGDGSASIEDTPNHVYVTDGAYDVRLVALDTITLCTDTFHYSLQIWNKPQAEILLIGDTIICSDDAAYLVANATGSYFWSTGEVMDTILVTSQGWYFLAVMDSNACIGRDSVYISQSQNPILEASVDTFIVSGNSIGLSASGANSYSWFTNLTQPSFNTSPQVEVAPTSNTMYYVMGSNSVGCNSIDSIYIKVYENYWIDCSNTITPNGDGKNDAFYIKNYYMFQGCELSIFDAWGVSVFSTQNAQDIWDGSANGKKVPTDTYFYEMQCDKKENSFHGVIHVIY